MLIGGVCCVCVRVDACAIYSGSCSLCSNAPAQCGTHTQQTSTARISVPEHTALGSDWRLIQTEANSGDDQPRDALHTCSALMGLLVMHCVWCEWSSGWCSSGSTSSSSLTPACRAGTASGPSSISCSGGVWYPPNYSQSSCPVTPTSCAAIVSGTRKQGRVPCVSQSAHSQECKNRSPPDWLLFLPGSLLSTDLLFLLHFLDPQLRLLHSEQRCLIVVRVALQQLQRTVCHIHRVVSDDTAELRIAGQSHRTRRHCSTEHGDWQRADTCAWGVVAVNQTSCSSCNSLSACGWCSGSNTCGSSSVCTTSSCSTPPAQPGDGPGSFTPISDGGPDGTGKRYFYAGSPNSDSNSRAAIPLLTFTLISFIAGLILVSCVGRFVPKAASKVGQVGFFPRMAANRAIVALALIAEGIVFLLILVACGVNSWSIYTSDSGGRQTTYSFGQQADRQ